MNVTCPNCATIYRVDPLKVPEAGVRARCAICSAIFPVHREAPPAAPISVPVAAAPATAMPTPPESKAAPTPAPAPAAAAGESPSMAQPAVGLPSRPVSRPMPSTPVPPATPTPVMPPASRPAGPPRPAAPPAFAGLTRPAASSSPSGAAVPTAAASVAPAAPSPAPAPAAKPPESAPRLANPFLSQDPALKARRLARALISDMVVYHPAKRQEGLRDGTLKALFEEEIKKSWEEYTEQVGAQVAEATPFFREALNEILAGGKQVF